MKSRKLYIFASVILATGMLLGVTGTAAAFSNNGWNGQLVADVQANGGNGNGGGNGSGTTGTANGCYGTLCLETSTDLSVGSLTDAEQAGLLYMVEEEKLARDVYQFLAAKWNLALFTNIALSEQTHMDALLGVIDAAGLTSPVTGTAGTFSNSNLQALYNELTAKGSQSLVDALLVGGAIEEIDIRDLQSTIAATSNSELSRVYTNLLSGSYNHLQAFAREYELQTGAVYTPQYLDATAYQAAMNSTTGMGNNGTSMGMGNGGRRRR
jgi:hypothetical protein